MMTTVMIWISLINKKYTNLSKKAEQIELNIKLKGTLHHNQVWFTPTTQGWFTKHTSKDLVYHVKKKTIKEKYFDKI